MGINSVSKLLTTVIDPGILKRYFFFHIRAAIFFTISSMGSKGWRSGESAHLHQCGSGSNPGIDAILIYSTGLSLLFALSFTPKGFSPGTPVFPLLKNKHFQIPIQPGIR